MANEENIELEDNSSGDELLNNIDLIVDKNQSPLRIDKYIITHSILASRSKLQAGA